MTKVWSNKQSQKMHTNGTSNYSFLRNRHTDFHSDFSSVYPHQQWRVFLSLQTLYHLLLINFVMIAILSEVRWNFSIVLIYTSQMTSDAKHFFMFYLPYIFHISISLSEKYLFQMLVLRVEYLMLNLDCLTTLIDIV